MYEFWCATMGHKLEKRHEWKHKEEAYEQFCRQVNAAFSTSLGWFMELRRPDGSIIARCTVHAENPPK